MKRFYLLILATILAVTVLSSTPVQAAKLFEVKAASRSATLTAFTRARSSMTLVAEESGRVEKVLADVGDTLPKSGLFAELDKTFMKLDLDSIRADQQRLKSDFNYYKKELERYKKLVKTENAAQSTLDSNVRAYQTAQQQLRATQIQEKVLMERLKRLSLVGPSGWKVVTRHIEPGEWVNKGEPVAELGYYDVLLVPYAFSSAEYGALKALDDTVPLRLTDLDVDVQATVARVSPGFDSKTRKINVDLEITKGDFEFRGGLRTELYLKMPDPGGAVLVPKSALLKAYEEYFLMTPEKKRVRVMLLGSTKNNIRRISSPNVKPGMKFLVTP